MIFVFSPFLLTSLCVQWMGSQCIYIATRKSVIQSCHGSKREGKGEVHFITVGCVPSWKPAAFLDRGYYEHSDKKCRLASRQLCAGITKHEGMSEWLANITR